MQAARSKQGRKPKLKFQALRLALVPLLSLSAFAPGNPVHALIYISYRIRIYFSFAAVAHTHTHTHSL